jgi:hypothetical protein
MPVLADIAVPLAELVRLGGAVVLLLGLVWTAVVVGYFLRPPTKV